jgi:hypothetical protein
VVSRREAAAASALLAMAFLHVRDSHFGVTDVPATFLALVSFLYIVRFAQGGSRKDMLLSAVFAGLATSTKYNAAIIAVPAVVAVAGLRLTTSDSTPGRAVRARQAVAFAAAMALAFLFGTPYALLDWRQFATDVLAQSDRLAAAHGLLLGRGWIVHLTTSLRYGLGLPLLAAAIAGFAWMFRAERRTALLLGIFPVTYFVAMGWGLTVFARYMLPIVPFLCLAGAWTVTRAARAIVPAAAPSAARGLVIFTAAAAVIAPSAWNVVQLDRLLATQDSRLVALAWLKDRAIDEASVFQSGKIYSRVQFEIPTSIKQTGEWGFDEARGGFTVDGAPTSGEPEFVIVQTSALELYTSMPRGLDTILARDYERIWHVAARDPGVRSNVYDLQDAFFLPLAGFAGIERPGPNIDIYRRRPLTP